MDKLVITFGSKSAEINIEDPDMPKDDLTALMYSAAEMVMGRAERRFEKLMAQARELGHA